MISHTHTRTHTPCCGLSYAKQNNLALVERCQLVTKCLVTKSLLVSSLSPGKLTARAQTQPTTGLEPAHQMSN